MELGTPIAVLDPYGWLPAHGETSVAARQDDLDWVLEIMYEEVTHKRMVKRELRFNNAACFYYTIFPGPNILNITYAQGATHDKPGMLWEFPQSEGALAWTHHWGGRRVVKHFGIWFLSENIAFQIFAERFVLIDPVPV